MTNRTVASYQSGFAVSSSDDDLTIYVVFETRGQAEQWIAENGPLRPRTGYRVSEVPLVRLGCSYTLTADAAERVALRPERETVSGREFMRRKDR